MTWKLSWRWAVIAFVVMANIFAIVDTSEAGRRCRRRRGGCGNSCGYSSCQYNSNCNGYQNQGCQSYGGCGNTMQYAPGEPMPPAPMMNQTAPSNQPAPPQAMNGYPSQSRQQSGYRGQMNNGQWNHGQTMNNGQMRTRQDASAQTLNGRQTTGGQSTNGQHGNEQPPQPTLAPTEQIPSAQPEPPSADAVPPSGPGAI